MKIISYIIVGSLLLFLESCISVEPGETLPVDSTIKFKIYESYPEYSNDNNIGDPKITLLLFMENEYPCLGYKLNLDKYITGRNININIYNIKVPDICLTAIGPADSYLNLDLPNGKYYLNIRVKRQVDKYTINISDSEIKIEGTAGRISEPLYKKYFRYPKLSFAYYCGTLMEDKYICEDFIDTLKTKLSIQEFFFPEDGQKPYPDSSGGYYYEMPARLFLYESEEEYDKIENVLKQYKENVIKDKMGIGLRTINWQNKGFYSWLY